jgi:DedD protein
MLPEKKRARRRLVGAVALVLAAVIGLPMILDSEPKPVGGDIAIQIPSRDKSLPSAVTPTPAAVPASVTAPDATSGGAPAAAPATPANVPPPALPTAGADKTADLNALKAKASASASAASVPATSAVAAPDAGKTKSKEHDAKQAVDSHADKVADQSTDKADAKSAKPAESHDDARAEAILRGGKDIDAAKPATDKKADKSEKSDKTAGKFAVQVAALASLERVTELQGKLSDAGFKSYTQKVPTTSGDRIRVRVGPFSTKDEADSARAKLGKLGLNGTLVPT